MEGAEGEFVGVDEVDPFFGVFFVLHGAGIGSPLGCDVGAHVARDHVGHHLAAVLAAERALRVGELDQRGGGAPAAERHPVLGDGGDAGGLTRRARLSAAAEHGQHRGDDHQQQEESGDELQAVEAQTLR